VLVVQGLEDERHQPLLIFIWEGKFSLHMTHALEDPNRDIGPRLCSKFRQLTRVMDIDARITSSMHNINGAARIVVNGILRAEGCEIVPCNNACHEDSARREKGWIVIARQLGVPKLEEIRNRSSERSILGTGV